MALTEKDFEGIEWNDLSIQKFNDRGDNVMILICNDTQSAERLYRIITTSNYDIQISITPYKFYRIDLDFIDTDFGVGFVSRRTEGNYPPVNWLKTGQVGFITSGYWESQGRSMNIQPYFPISSTVNFN